MLAFIEQVKDVEYLDSKKQYIERGKVYKMSGMLLEVFLEDQDAIYYPQQSACDICDWNIVLRDGSSEFKTWSNKINSSGTVREDRRKVTEVVANFDEINITLVSSNYAEKIFDPNLNTPVVTKFKCIELSYMCLKDKVVYAGKFWHENDGVFFAFVEDLFWRLNIPVRLLNDFNWEGDKCWFIDYDWEAERHCVSEY